MISLSLNELKLVAKSRGIKGYKSKSEDELIKILSEPRPKIILSKKRIKKIEEKFDESRDKFCKSKIKEIRRILHEMKNKNILSTSKIKEIEKNLFELEKIFEPKKYYDYDDIKCKGIRDVRNLFGLSIDEDYYKPIKTNDAFNGNYIEYKSKGGKDKTLSMKEYFDMIKQYLSSIINDHKTQGKWKVHSDNTITDYKTQGEWKIQLTMAINFMSSKNSDGTCTMHTKSNNIEIMIGNETNDIIGEL